MVIKSEKDLAEAIKNEQDIIEIEGDLGKKVLRIKATGKAAWIVAMGAIAIVVTGMLYPVPEPTTQTVSKFSALTGAGAAVGIWGAETTTAAILIALASGGVGILNKLRKYKVVSTANDRVVLKRA